VAAAKEDVKAIVAHSTMLQRCWSVIYLKIKVGDSID
jgi:hypothetical protein